MDYKKAFLKLLKSNDSLYKNETQTIKLGNFIFKVMRNGTFYEIRVCYLHEDFIYYIVSLDKGYKSEYETKLEMPDYFSEWERNQYEVMKNNRNQVSEELHLILNNI